MSAVRKYLGHVNCVSRQSQTRHICSHGLVGIQRPTPCRLRIPKPRFYIAQQSNPTYAWGLCSQFRRVARLRSSNERYLLLDLSRLERALSSIEWYIEHLSLRTPLLVRRDELGLIFIFR
jgi:hypothetical protein